MATLTVRNIPEAVYERLRERAARNRRSLSGEVVTLLEGTLLGTPPGEDPWLAEAEAADAWFPEPLPDLSVVGKRAGRKYEDDLPPYDPES